MKKEITVHFLRRFSVAMLVAANAAWGAILWGQAGSTDKGTEVRLFEAEIQKAQDDLDSKDQQTVRARKARDRSPQNQRALEKADAELNKANADRIWAEYRLRELKAKARSEGGSSRSPANPLGEKDPPAPAPPREAGPPEDTAPAGTKGKLNINRDFLAPLIDAENKAQRADGKGYREDDVEALNDVYEGAVVIDEKKKAKIKALWTEMNRLRELGNQYVANGATPKEVQSLKDAQRKTIEDLERLGEKVNIVGRETIKTREK